MKRPLRRAMRLSFIVSLSMLVFAHCPGATGAVNSSNSTMGMAREVKERPPEIRVAQGAVSPSDKKGDLGVSCGDLLKSFDRMQSPKDAGRYDEISVNFPYLAILVPEEVDKIRDLSNHCTYAPQPDRTDFIRGIIAKYLTSVREIKSFETTGVPTCATINNGKFLPDNKTSAAGVPMAYFDKLVEVARSCNSWRLDDVMALAASRKSAEMQQKTGLTDAIDILTKARVNLASAETDYRGKKFFFSGLLLRVGKTDDSKDYVYIVRPSNRADANTDGFIECHVSADDTNTVRQWSASGEGKHLQGIGVLAEIATQRAVNLLGIPGTQAVLRSRCSPGG